jgi:hypothetical protein
MKIAIFGDSYASTYAHNHAKPYPSWSEMLLTKYDVVNFSENGSSLYYMKRIFDREHRKFDKIVFCITAPTRLEFKVETLEKNLNYTPWYQHIPTIHTIKQRLQIPELTELDKKRYKILYDYILEIQDLEQEQYKHTMMLNDITTQRQDTILIPAFPTSIDGQTNCLEDITRFEDSIFNKTTGTYFDGRLCHMSLENNKVVFDIVEDALLINKTKINLSRDKFVEPSANTKFLLEDF